jgi:hypothetical protein
MFNTTTIKIKDRKEEKQFIIAEMSAMTVLMKFLPMLAKCIKKDELIKSLNLVLQTGDANEKDKVDNISPVYLFINTIYELLSNASLEQQEQLYKLILKHVKVTNSLNQSVSIEENTELYVKSAVILGKLIYEVLKLTFTEVYNDFLELTGKNSE